MARQARNKQMPALLAELGASPGNQDPADLRSVNIWRKPTNNDPVHSGQTDGDVQSEANKTAFQLHLLNLSRKNIRVLVSV